LNYESDATEDNANAMIVSHMSDASSCSFEFSSSDEEEEDTPERGRIAAIEGGTAAQVPPPINCASYPPAGSSYPLRIPVANKDDTRRVIDNAIEAEDSLQQQTMEEGETLLDSLKRNRPAKRAIGQLESEDRTKNRLQQLEKEVKEKGRKKHDKK
jgi:hypothetical protein